MNTKKCIHNYLLKCETGSMPPGLLDFMRGTIALYYYSKKYGYDLLINKNIHPVFKYFKDCEYFINDGTQNIEKTFELLSQADCKFVDHILEKLFVNGNNIYILTNCYIENKHNYNNNNILSDESRQFIQTLLRPNDILLEKLLHVYNHLNILPDENYLCIHIRFGDKYLHSNNIDFTIINSIDQTIKNILNAHSKNRIVLVTDSSTMAYEIIKINKTLLYWNNRKIHTGFLIDYDEEAMKDTLVDLLVLSKSSKIFTFNIDQRYSTTFSPLIAKIYNIENIIFQLVG